ncbi:hypothetical protein GBA52_009022 [Prunus armeniaca]|nr:hypothetical protein GBA52_009022 [Prunus armeniaca]
MVKDDRNGRTGFTWFKAYNPHSKKVVSVGGWVNGDEMDARVERVEEITSENGWRKFGRYVIVESFSLRRMDGSLAWISDFRHADKIRCKWEQGFVLDCCQGTKNTYFKV